MTARFTFRPFQIAVGEKLPRMAVVHLMLVGERHVHAVLIQCPHAKRERPLPCCALAFRAKHTQARIRITVFFMLIPPPAGLC